MYWVGIPNFLKNGSYKCLKIVLNYIISYYSSNLLILSIFYILVHFNINKHTPLDSYGFSFLNGI